ncbi:Vms1/Ankzf1 family peptidyl-tRNA hydrolase [Lentzea sp. NPDC051208]|uniref:baeRF2 domain-containing protein n=1 Tax=Lentzea sp. NPDC051208 TaxID=3154642 RepID=UPI00341C9EDC
MYGHVEVAENSHCSRSVRVGLPRRVARHGGRGQSRRTALARATRPARGPGRSGGNARRAGRGGVRGRPACQQGRAGADRFGVQRAGGPDAAGAAAGRCRAVLLAAGPAATRVLPPSAGTARRRGRRLVRRRHSLFRRKFELVEAVRGKQHPLHKTGGGGYAHRRLQQRMEDTVKHNVKQVADEVRRLASEVRAELVVLGGEVQARTAVRSELDLDDDLIVEVEGAGLAGGTHDEVFDKVVCAFVAQRQQQHDAEVVERFRAELGRDGLAAVTHALRQANVNTLVVNTDVLANQQVWTSSQPGQVGADEASVRPSADDPSEVERNRADDALARAMAVTPRSLDFCRRWARSATASITP